MSFPILTGKHLPILRKQWLHTVRYALTILRRTFSGQTKKPEGQSPGQCLGIPQLFQTQRTPGGQSPRGVSLVSHSLFNGVPGVDQTPGTPRERGCHALRGRWRLDSPRRTGRITACPPIQLPCSSRQSAAWPSGGASLPGQAWPRPIG